jgi:hypothetical protein
MRRSTRIAIASCVALAVIVTVIWLQGRGGEPGSLASLCDLQTTRVTRLLVRDGTTGEARTSSDPEKIGEVLDLLASTTFTRRSGQAPRAGYQHYADLYTEDEHACRVTLAGSSATIDGTHYEADRDLNAELAPLLPDLEPGS